MNKYLSLQSVDHKRKLTSIQKIESLEPIENADKIERARILGWSCVVKKGVFKENDKCVYFEVDSVLPDHPDFAFLKRKDDDFKSLRLKTVRLRGALSQGLALPLCEVENVFKQYAPEAAPDINVEWIDYLYNLPIGFDVTNFLGVRKYEPPEQVTRRGNVSGSFPNFLHKTDEIRIQSEPGLLKEIQGKEVYFSVKLDGCSGTYAYYKEKFFVCSRNWTLKDTKKKKDWWWHVAHQYDLESRLKSIGNFAVQGEIVGPGIQKNRLHLDKIHLILFDVFDIDKDQYLGYDDFIAFCKEHNFNHVPVEWEGKFNFTIEQLLEKSEGKYERTQQQREGIVVRPKEVTMSNVLGKRLSFKVISNQFLLKNKQ